MVGFETSLTVVGLLGVLSAAIATGLAWADRRLRPDTEGVVDAIDALLPQTQCAQCGYPGCRPYAEAVAAGAAIDLCPPGGPETIRSLETLLGRTSGRGGAGHVEPMPGLRAKIDESRCIGCFRCIQACPVDAIVGAPQLMHTVLPDLCTGCELCLDPCPVDCIELVSDPGREIQGPLRIMARPRNREPQAAELPCIRCARCEVTCPEALKPQELLWYARDGAWEEARAQGLDDCIECGLCNQVCPSNIDLLVHFSRGRLATAAQQENCARAQAAKDRFSRHQARIQAREAQQERSRRFRLGRSGDRPWLS
jgi:electron transport complex protein RnfB